MITPQKVIVPGILIGSLVLILTARLLTSTQVVSASTPEAAASTFSESAVETQEAAVSCSLTLPDKISSWCSLIESASQTYGVSPALVSAVMLQESGGQSDVISTSGAVGLMQVMPSDGLAAEFMCANGPCFASRPTTQQLLEPSINVDYGVRMLASLVQKYGNERDALKAYGPYNVGYYYADKVMAIRDSIMAE